jgi:hypothetical protein
MADTTRPVRDLTKDPTMTVAMGMKLTQVSQDCWRGSCEKEQRIREEWYKTYRPTLCREEDDIVARVNARDAERLATIKADPTRRLLGEGVSKDGKGRIAYLKARRNLPPQERFGTPMTASHETGWRCLELPPPRIDGLPTYGRKPVIKNGFFRRTIGGSLAQV